MRAAVSCDRSSCGLTNHRVSRTLRGSVSISESVLSNNQTRATKPNEQTGDNAYDPLRPSLSLYFLKRNRKSSCINKDPRRIRTKSLLVANVSVKISTSRIYIHEVFKVTVRGQNTYKKLPRISQ